MDIVLSGKIRPLPVGFENLKEVEEYIDLDCSGVKTLTVTAENIKDCRKLRAYFNSQAKLFHEMLKSYTEGYMSDFNVKIKAPLQRFEKQYKEAADQVNKKVREMEKILNPPEPEEVKNVILTLSCTDREYAKVIKFLDKEEIAYETNRKEHSV